MEAKARQENIFSFSKERPFSPQFYDVQHVYEQLGYQLLNPETTRYQELYQQFHDFYRRSVVQIPNGILSMEAGKLKEDPTRLQLDPPRVNVLERDGNYFYEFLYADDRLRIIVDATLTESTFPIATTIEGYPIEQLLIQGADYRLLDLASLRRGEPLRNLFQFSGLTPHMFPEQIGLSKDRKTRVNYPPYVLMGMKVQNTEGSLSWRPEVFAYTYLHENGHAALMEYDQARYKQPDTEATSVMRITIERDADAIAMTTARSVINTNSFSSPLFNLQAQEEWTQEHLGGGYNIIAAGRGKPYTHYATRESRAKARQQSRSKTE